MLPARDHRLEAAAEAAAAAAGGEGTELSAPGHRSPSSNASARNAISRCPRADAGAAGAALTGAALSERPGSLATEERGLEETPRLQLGGKEFDNLLAPHRPLPRAQLFFPHIATATDVGSSFPVHFLRPG